MDWLSDGKELPLAVILSGVVTYAAVVILVRLTGKRTLADFNAFDLLVTVGMGTLLGTTVINDTVSVLEGLIGIATLVAIQFAISKLSLSSEAVRDAVKPQPRAVLIDGQFDEGAMSEERVTRSEILAAVRASGNDSTDAIGAVVLETNGSLSAITPAFKSGRKVSTTRDRFFEKFVFCILQIFQKI